MKKDNISNATAQDFIRKISVEIEQVVPSQNEMIAEIKMMRFKIRPLVGDLFSLSGSHRGPLITSLWKLGKIEETMHSAFETLDQDEMDDLFDYLDELQKKLNQGFGYDENGTFFADAHPTHMLKLEIFRDPHHSDLHN